MCAGSTPVGGTQHQLRRQGFTRITDSRTREYVADDNQTVQTVGGSWAECHWYSLVNMELPMFDDRGGSLVSFARLDDNLLEGSDGAVRPVCSLVVVEFGQRVLLGFNVSRQ